MNTERVQAVNESEFEAQVLRSVQPVLVGFLADWSKPSRLLEAALDTVANDCKDKVKVLKVNVDDYPDLGATYSIQSVPTLVYFLQGAVRAKIIGMASPKAVLAQLNLLMPGIPPTNEPRSCGDQTRSGKI